MTRNFSVWMVPLILVLIQPIGTVGSESNGGKDSRPTEWQILTKINYSDEIRRHPHLLLMITVPWCGESRSLKKELVNVVAGQQERFGTLKLMLLYRNNDRMLANALGSSKGLTIIYFHHSFPYKYGGRLRVWNLLSSIHFVMSLPPGELPLKFLNTPDDLRSFLGSTDKSLLLLEFCGWTPRLLANSSSEENNGTQMWEEKKQKAMGGNKMSCSVQNGFNIFPSFGEFILRNDGNILPEPENFTTSGDGFTCTLDELQRLESFFPKFIKLARDFFLPPENLRFGLVSERSLLSELDINTSATWSMILHSAGCPSCSKIVREGDDLRVVLETQDSIVQELRDDVHDVTTLSANRPSVLLFIDRSSESLSIREKSKEALHVFRELSLHYQNPNQKVQSTLKSKTQALSTSKISRSEMFPALPQVNLKDKMSIMIMNDGRQISLKNVVSNFEGDSLHEVLANLIQGKSESKLSSIAKDVGFELVSHDYEIKGTDDKHAQPECQLDQVLELPTQGDIKVIANLGKDSKVQCSGTSKVTTDEETKPSEPGSLQLFRENDPIQESKRSFERLTNLGTSTTASYDQDRKLEEERLAQVPEQMQNKNFSGSFFFCDGHLRLLKALTAASNIPTLVIVDPITQKHFILPESEVFDFSSLSDFIDGFLNGSLLPYQQTQTVVQRPRETPRPPFVNLDFHEAVSIPRVTAHSFADMVIGNESASKPGDAWDTDVLVVFTNGWCGFCQRMEMVVREVFRAIQGYSNVLKAGSRSENFLLTKVFRNVADDMKIPLIYLMDCTLNDCSFLLNSLVQREVYPSLLLFPAGRKNAIIYDGDVTVYDVIKFLADHGTLNAKGISWAEVEKVGSFSGNAPLYQSIYHEVLFKNQITENVAAKKRGHSWSDTRESIAQVVAGSILTATDKLINAPQFDESKILIVEADQESRGYEGLIFNKQISWESLEELDGDMQMLKEAPLSYGGPVMKHGMPLVALARKSEDCQHLEILPDVHFIDQWGTVKLLEEIKLGNKSVNGYWFFLGFSSWGWEQLFREIAEGAWDVSKGSIEKLEWPEVS